MWGYRPAYNAQVRLCPPMPPTRCPSSHETAVCALLGALSCLATAEDGSEVLDALACAQRWCRVAEACIEQTKVEAERKTTAGGSGEK
jgi:hypothetical protein